MRNLLQLRPIHNTYVDILSCFQQGKPLSNNQLNFLRRYSSKISDPTIDAVVKYYKIFNQELQRKSNKIGKALNYQFLQNLYKLLSNKFSCGIETFEIKLTRKQFFQFKTLLLNDLIYFHGNHVLTGAPFFAGGLPHVDFFQWGNLFGIVKYEEILGEKNTDGNILIFFEEQADRSLEQFVQSQLQLIHHAPTSNKIAKPESNFPAELITYSPYKK